MEATFKGINCPNQRPVFKVCISEECKISPFLCQHSSECRCEDRHNHNCIIKSIKQLDENIKNILKFQFFIVYSPTLKGSSIYIAGRYAVQTKPPINNQRFALTYDSIPLTSTEAVSFRLTKIKGCVGVGIFKRQTILKNEYRYIPDPNYLNHGCYMLLSNGLLYSDSRPEQNGKTVKVLELKENDMIKVRFQDNKAIFSSKLLEQCLNIDSKIAEHLHFGVYLYELQDEVQIVNTFVSGE